MIFVGNDWAEDHHDVHVMDEQGSRLAARRFPEGIEGVRSFHTLIGAYVDDPGQVVIEIETDRGLWVNALSRPASKCTRSTPRQPPGTGTDI